MKKLLIASLLLICSVTINAQENNLTLDEMITLLNCSTLSSFEVKAKTFGFTYTEKYVASETRTEYYYNRSISANGYDVKQAIAYYENSDSKPSVIFTTSHRVSTSYTSEIEKQAKNSGYTKSPNSKKKELLYFNGTYILEMYDYTKDDKKKCYIVGVSYQ